jgi:hypothetical protein
VLAPDKVTLPVTTTAPLDVTPASAMVREFTPAEELMVKVSVVEELPRARIPVPVKLLLEILLPFVARVRPAGIFKDDGSIIN